MNIIGKCPFCDGPVRILEVREEVVQGVSAACAKFECEKCRTEFLVPKIRTNMEQNITKDLIKKFNTRKPIENILEQSHNAGGCDGTTDYDKGWDDAMAEIERTAKGFIKGGIK